MKSSQDLFVLAVWGLAFIVLIYQFFRSIRLVPTKSAYIVERLGEYYKTLDAGFHALIPFVDRVTYIRNLKEETIDVPPQDCFTKDEVNVIVDGVLYISVIDPVKASYGVDNYRFAAVQLAQTTTRSVIGTLDLDTTFEERDFISAKVVEVLNQAGTTWGINVHRYEIKNISPPQTVQNAMEKVVNAERERRAILATSEGQKMSMIRKSEGIKQEMINRSEGEMQKRINEAEGKAQEILSIAQANAESILKISEAISVEGGMNAVRLQLQEKYIDQMKNISNGDQTQIIVPDNLINYESWISNIKI